jgi:Arc/MetJ-type ribon-helix-helix transcriptional regulator
MQITLNPDQEMAIQTAIQTGLIRSVDEFIAAAVESLPRRDAGFDKDKARSAGARIREIRKGVRLDLQGMSIRELAHAGHKSGEESSWRCSAR